mmetsp:Transcript_5545/g.8442  ORF Transcript_5545/g.8442 Transcript_5545/m.8442 type:complete len:187 (+) Transcript_5545:67-627(+)
MTDMIQKIETGDSIKVKQVLDESTVEALKENGYDINYTSDNIKLGLMFVSCLFAMIAQFYPLPFPESRPLLGVCCFSYFVLSTILQYIITFVDKDTIATTLPRNGDESTSFKVDAKFPKFQEYYTVTIRPNVDNSTQRTTGKMYVGKYFTGEGEFDQVGFMNDIKTHVQRFRSKKYNEFEYNHKSD